MKPEGKGAGSKKERVEIDFSKVKIEPLFEEEVDFDTFSKSDFRAVKIKSCEEVKKSDKLLDRQNICPSCHCPFALRPR